MQVEVFIGFRLLITVHPLRPFFLQQTRVLTRLLPQFVEVAEVEHLVVRRGQGLYYGVEDGEQSVRYWNAAPLPCESSNPIRSAPEV